MSLLRVFRHKAFWICALVVVIGLAVWGWQEREPLLAWHYAKWLAAADAQECGSHVDRLAPLGSAALPPLVRQLRVGDETAKVNCGWALAEFARRWDLDAPETRELSAQLLAGFEEFDPFGKNQALQVWLVLLHRSTEEQAPGWLIDAVEQVVEASSRGQPEFLLPTAVELSARYLYSQRNRSLASSTLENCRKLLAAGLSDRRPECRVGAIRLASAPGLGQLEPVAALLTGASRDPAPQVRLNALLALGGHEDLLPTDDVLPFLHDTDAEVRAVAEQALRSRGLQAGHLQLARQMTDPQPHVRARVPGLIQDFPDLDTRLWLERLSRDSSPAVRAAVVRAAGEDNQWQLAERMREMARGDPSATVRQIARYYLERQVYQNP